MNSLCIINGLDNTNFFESLYNGSTFSLHMIMQIKNPAGIEKFQMWQFRWYLDIGRVFTTF